MKITAVEVVEVVGGDRQALYVEVRTDGEHAGRFGPVQPPQADVIRRSIAPALVGADPLATEALHDRMLQLDRHGRSGVFLTGLSPVDCALWDLKGKVLGLPVWRLLGGPTRDRVPAYASMLGHSVDPDDAVVTATRSRSRATRRRSGSSRTGLPTAPPGWPATSIWRERCAARSGRTTG